MATPGEAYGIVEATPAWVLRRIRALSATLHLPCPVRDRFLFEADEAFYGAGLGPRRGRAAIFFAWLGPC